MARPKQKPLPSHFIDRDQEARDTIEAAKRLQTEMAKVWTPEIQQLAEKTDNEEVKAKLRQAHEQIALVSERLLAAQARLEFQKFAKYMEGDIGHTMLPGKHFDVMADAFQRVIEGEEVRLIINIAPRRGKSVYSSLLFPAWYLGRFPNKKIIHIGNVKSLAADFGAKIRNLIDTDRYKNVFPDVVLSKDATAKDRFRTIQKGEYFAVGVGGTVTGRGGDLIIVDDPHTETESIDGNTEPPSKDDYDKTFNWFNTVPLIRLQPGGSILIIMQRWAKGDLSGRLVESSKRNKGVLQWDQISIPALVEAGKNERGDTLYESTWPEYWSTKAMIEKRETMLNEPGGAWRWNSMYQQSPGSDSASIFKREYWRVWPDFRPIPKCDFIIQSWDIAATANDRSNYSACVTLGVFTREGYGGKPVYNLIVLGAERGKWEFPDLKKAVKRIYNIEMKDRHDKKTTVHPDCLIVEFKSSGQALVQELRSAGIPITAYRPQSNQYTARNDKFARGQRVLEIVSSGLVWMPNKPWAEELKEEMADFPNGEYDDWYDAMVQALSRFREGGFIRLDTDDDDDWGDKTPKYSGYYNLG